MTVVTEKIAEPPPPKKKPEEPDDPKPEAQIQMDYSYDYF